LINAGLTLGPQTPQGRAKKLVSWSRVLTSKDVIAGNVELFLLRVCRLDFLQLVLHLPAQVRGLNLKASAFYAMLPAIAMAVFCILGGKLSDGLTRLHGPRVGRCILASIAVLIAGVFVASGALVENARVASIVLASGAGAAICVPEFLLVSNC